MIDHLVKSMSESMNTYIYIKPSKKCGPQTELYLSDLLWLLMEVKMQPEV
jgi:hypothetical protein